MFVRRDSGHPHSLKYDGDPGALPYESSTSGASERRKYHRNLLSAEVVSIPNCFEPIPPALNFN